MLGEVNLLHFQKESFPAFSGLIFSSSTESADNLAEVILESTDTRYKTLLFCPMFDYTGLRLDICTIGSITGQS